MPLIWHIFRKDLRHTKYYLAAALLLLIAGGWNLVRMINAAFDSRVALTPVQNAVATLGVAAWLLFFGVLLLAEPLPGLRQYWLTRPIRWQSLLGAKSLMLAAGSVLPVFIVHCVIVLSRGLPLFEHLGAILWNAALFSFLCFLFVATLASVSRNLQQLILWALALGFILILSTQLAFGHAASPVWVVGEAALLLAIVGGIAIVLWQYATRQTRAGRIALVVLTLFIASMQSWPRSFWFSVQHALSPVKVDAAVGQLFVDPSRSWLDLAYRGGRTAGSGQLTLDLRIENLPEGWTAELDGWSDISVTAEGETDRGPFIFQTLTLDGSGQQRSFRVPMNEAFVQKHRGKLADISIMTELALYGPPQEFVMASSATTEIPGFGRCQAETIALLLITCESILDPSYRVKGQWAKDKPQPNSPVVLTTRENRSPTRLSPSMYPIELVRGGFGATSDYSQGNIHISLRKPMAYVQRRLEARGIKLSSEQPSPASPE